MLDVSTESDTKPMPHQKRAMDAARNREGFAYLMEMGTGKTATVIWEAVDLYRRDRINGMLVLAPLGVCPAWYDRRTLSGELITHTPRDVRDELRIGRWESGMSERMREELRGFLMDDNPGLRVFLVNIEALSHVPMARDLCRSFLAQQKCMMVIDESTSIKSLSATRTKIATKLGRRALYRRILTGSPITNSPEDVYSQFNFLKPGYLGHRSIMSFRNEFCLTKDIPVSGRIITVTIGARNVEDLAERVGQHSFRVLKSECLDLPPKVYQRRTVMMDVNQRRVYYQMKRAAFAIMNAGAETRTISAQLVITQLLRMHQIVVGHITTDDGNTVWMADSRLKELMDVLAESSQKTIIWSAYRRDLQRIAVAVGAMYGPESVVQYHGGVSGAGRSDAINRFQNGDARFFVANQQTGGRGLNLTAAEVVVYYSNSYDLEMRIQSEDRAHRQGQRRSVTYVDLVAAGTVDEAILDALKGKMDLVQAILRDGPQKWLNKLGYDNAHSVHL